MSPAKTRPSLKFSSGILAKSEGAERILAAAELLFAELGFDGVSMHAVAARAGVSKANVFHHFGTKNDLYLAVLRAACADSREQLEQMVISTGPLTERLRTFAQQQLYNMLERDSITRVILRELLRDGERRGRELAEQVYGDSFAKLVALLRTAQAQGELRADIDPAMAATLLIGANVFFFEARDVLRYFPDIKFANNPAHYTQMLVDILLRGIGLSRQEAL